MMSLPATTGASVQVNFPNIDKFLYMYFTIIVLVPIDKSTMIVRVTHFTYK